MQLSTITAAILAGGPGTRLQPAVADRPKALAPILHRPFLAFLLDQLAAAGIRHAVLCTGYMHEKVPAALGTSHGSIRLSYSPEPTPLGTAGTLRLALPLLDSDPVLVLNGDSYCHTNLQDFLTFHQTQHAQASLLLTTVPDISRFGTVLTDPHHRISRFAEKSPPTNPPTPGPINAGIYLLSRAFIATIPPNRPVSLESDIFPTAPLHAHLTNSPFLDIGTPASYHAAEQFFSTLQNP